MQHLCSHDNAFCHLSYSTGLAQRVYAKHSFGRVGGGALLGLIDSTAAALGSSLLGGWWIGVLVLLGILRCVVQQQFLTANFSRVMYFAGSTGTLVNKLFVETVAFLISKQTVDVSQSCSVTDAVFGFGFQLVSCFSFLI